MNLKTGNDGYLRPLYWKCIVCNTDKSVSHAVRANIFLMKLKNENNFQELEQANRLAIKGVIEYCLTSKPRPINLFQFEDTYGLARAQNGMGFDAVYLCDIHFNEFMQGSF